MINFKSIKTQLVLYLVCFAFFWAFKNQDFSFLVAIAIAVASSLSAESILKYLKTKSLQVTESSIITGLIVGFVLSSDEIWWKIVLAAVLAILSKYIIRFRNRHIFNPAAFGIFLTIILFKASTQWNGTYLWYIILPFGLYFTAKVKKWELILGYAITAIGLFALQAYLNHTNIWNIFGYLSYFYIFVMIIEPLTTPNRPLGKYIFGAGLAATIFNLTEFGVRFDVELFSLLVMNAFVPLLNHLSEERKIK